MHSWLNFIRLPVHILGVLQSFTWHLFYWDTEEEFADKSLKTKELQNKKEQITVNKLLTGTREFMNKMLRANSLWKALQTPHLLWVCVRITNNKVSFWTLLTKICVLYENQQK